jgi:hypothetical protein
MSVIANEHQAMGKENSSQRIAFPHTKTTQIIKY